MSRESAMHVRLVELAAAEIKRRHKDLYSLTIYVDLPSAGLDRPEMIGGYAQLISSRSTRLKPAGSSARRRPHADCETPRSRLQFIAFLSHLSCFPNGLFYLAVPWFYRVRALTLIDSAAQAAGASAVKVRVI